VILSSVDSVFSDLSFGQWMAQLQGIHCVFEKTYPDNEEPLYVFRLESSYQTPCFVEKTTQRAQWQHTNPFDLLALAYRDLNGQSLIYFDTQDNHGTYARFRIPEHMLFDISPVQAYAYFFETPPTLIEKTHVQRKAF